MKPKARRAKNGTTEHVVVGGSYIVRLYSHRQDKNEVVGVVESPGDGTRHAFINRDDLWSILMGVGDRPAGDTKPDQISDK
jgi:hypothetical protein